MIGTLWLQIVIGARRLTPLLTTLFLAVLGGLPLYLPGYAAVAPMFALIAVYYWTIHRPDLLPAPAVFAVGLFVDLVSGVPLGVNGLILLLVYAVVLAQRRFFHGKSFLVVWWGFSLVAAVSAMVIWLLLALLSGQFPAPLPVAFQFGVNLAVYPLASWLLARAQRNLLRRA
ncbi:MAG: rod shape-determining protein MreD [Alphaproteobacteria bacterium]